MLKENEELTFLGPTNKSYLARVIGVDQDCTWVKVSELRMVYEVFPNQVQETGDEKYILSFDKKRSFEQLTDPKFLENDNFMLEAGTEKREDILNMIRAERLINPV